MSCLISMVWSMDIGIEQTIIVG